MKAAWGAVARFTGTGRRRELAELQALVEASGHELRTPLAALKLQLQGLDRQLYRRGLDAPELAARLVKCRAQLDRVEDSVEQLLHAVLPRAPRPSEEVDLAQLAVEVGTRLAEPLREAGCSLSVRLMARPIGAWDANGVARALAALLAHAFKHGAGLPIEVIIGAEDGWARLAVADGGPPLPPDELKALFSPSGRAVWERHFGSTGLSVWRCRDEILATGGALVVESSERRTIYTIELPCPRT